MSESKWENETDTKPGERGKLECMGSLLRQAFGGPGDEPWASFRPDLVKQLMSLD